LPENVVTPFSIRQSATHYFEYTDHVIVFIDEAARTIL